MKQYLLRRSLQMVAAFFAITAICFVIIQLPPSDFISRRMQEMERQGGGSATAGIEALKKIYHLDKSLPTQYVLWLSGILRGDFGHSLLYNAPVGSLIGQRFLLSLVVSFAALVFAYAIAIPIGMYSAVRQYSLGDQVFTVLGFLGLATPNFMISLFVVFVGSRYFNMTLTGLFSDEYLAAPWSLARVWNLLQHLWLPTIIVGTGAAAVIMRLVRERTLEILNQQYVTVARSKGLPEVRILSKHVFRIVANPLISIAGLTLPGLISGDVIVSIVLNLPTLGPLLLRALQTQDMYLAGAILLLMVLLLLIGNFLADVALALVDPRIRYD
jgi:peptide/nickel transport system permease protein